MSMNNLDSQSKSNSARLGGGTIAFTMIVWNDVPSPIALRVQSGDTDLMHEERVSHVSPADNVDEAGKCLRPKR